MTTPIDLSIPILIVNSHQHIQERVEAALVECGYKNIKVLSSATDALSLLRKQQVGILICDTEMDTLDGWRLARLIRSGVLEVVPTIPIILLSEVWSERIAEATAREYDINHILSLENIDQVPQCVEQALQSTNKPSLLVIEDTDDIARLVTRILHHRFDIEVAVDGEAGLQSWLEHRHDLVLLDVMLPKISGEKVLEEILKQESEQPVIMMTAHTAAEQACELMVAGAVDFISKPFRSEQLRKVTDIATRREDYFLSNQQFASRVKSLAESEAAYRAVSQTHEQLLNNLQTVVMEVDHNLRITFLNDAWKKMTGFTVDKSVGCLLGDFLTVTSSDKYRRQKTRLETILRDKQGSAKLEFSLVNKIGESLSVQARINYSNLLDGDPSLTICLDDITERKQAQKKLEYFAMHDSLTDLYNRRYFENALEKLTISAEKNALVHGLLYIDLDHFKVINDTFGHFKGDEVIREIAKIIGTHICATDILCRLGGDEYAVLVHNVEEQKIVDLASKLQAAIGGFNFHVEGQVFNLGCSIGISLIDGSTPTAEEYLMRADMALYVAKRRGRKLVHLFDPADSESDDLRSNINWVHAVNRAVAEGRIELFFQPVIHINTQKVYYYEALVRMRSEDGSIIYPGHFITALEETGDMPMLDRHIVKLAIATLKQQPRMNRIAINLSAQTFQDKSLVPMIKSTLDDANIKASQITFELTESASLFNISITQKVITEIQELGCSIAIDDFGSGFSSFAYLKELPAEYIKLDGSFIRNLHTDTVDQALVNSIVEVVKTLGKKTVAEFVENEEILQLLEGYGVDYAQGYHVGRPLPVGELPL